MAGSYSSAMDRHLTRRRNAAFLPEKSDAMSIPFPPEVVNTFVQTAKQKPPTPPANFLRVKIQQIDTKFHAGRGADFL